MNFKDLQSTIRETFRYEEGELYYHTQPRGRRTSLNTPAGTLGGDGYRSIYLGGKPWKAHRLIWVYHYGSLPYMLDHIDRNRLNNKIENLREVTKRQNLRNSKGYGKGSKFKGVHPTGSRLKKWSARICISDDPKRTDISKSFDSEEEAAHWYNSIAREWWGEYAFLNDIGGWCELRV